MFIGLGEIYFNISTSAKRSVIMGCWLLMRLAIVLADFLRIPAGIAPQGVNRTNGSVPTLVYPQSLSSPLG